MNAFLAWAQIERRKMTGTFMDLKELGRRWKALPERERQTHFNRARRLRLLHQKRNQNAKPQAKIILTIILFGPLDTFTFMFDICTFRNLSCDL